MKKKISAPFQKLVSKPLSALRRKYKQKSEFDVDNYVYTAFSNPHTDIRLLTLQPGNGSSPLVGSLSTHTIADTNNEMTLKWNSLSYCWDNPIDDDNIVDMNRTDTDSDNDRNDPPENRVKPKEPVKPRRYILLTVPNGMRRLPVHENLFEALQFLRSDAKLCSTYLWIDALCINQSDLAERSIQVSLMSRLFHRATAVIVWLGSFRDKRRTELRAWAANIMNDMAEEGDMAEEEVSRDRLIRDDKWKSFKTDKYKFIENPEYRVFWEGFDFLLSANWFQRIWTFSEAVLSSQLIMCGPGFTFDMDRWFDLTDTLHTHRSSYSQQLRGSMGDIAIAGTQSTYRISRLKGKRGYTTLDLLELMQVTEIYHATDKRDLIYGLLTLETRDRSKDIVPRPEADYTKPLSEVYTEFARYWLSNDFEIPFFNICFDPSVDFPAETTTVPSTAQSIIPTWVPDWSRSGHRRGLIYIPQDMMERLGCTGSRKYLDTSYPIHATHSPLRFLNKELLALRGLKFDRIKLISKAHGTVIRDPHEKDWFEFYSTSEHLAKSSSAKDTHQSRLRKEIWKLIIMERSLRTFNLDTIHAKSPIRTNDSVYNAFLQCLDLDHLFLTERGYIGCGIECAKEGDEIFFAYGTIMAFIIRRVGSKGEEDAAPEVGPKEKVDVEREELRGEKGEGKNATKAGIDKLPKDIYEIVDGSAYIHGLMNGGAIKIAKREGLGAEDVWFC